MIIEAEYKAGVGLRKLMKKYNIGIVALKKRLISSGIPINKPSVKKFGTEEALRQYKNGATITSLAQLYNVSEEAVWLRLRRFVELRNYEYYQKYKYDLSKLKNLSSEVGAYWFGFLLADGHKRKNSGFGQHKKCHVLVCKLSWRDKEHLTRLCRDMGVNKAIKIVNKYNKHRKKIYRSAILQINSKELCDYYRKKGFQQFKSGMGILLPKELNIRHFLRGIWDGDGAVSQNKKYLIMSYADMSREITELIQLLVINIVFKWTGIMIRRNKISHYKTKNGTDMFRIGWVGRQAVLIARTLYEKQTLCLRRKKEKIDRLLGYDRNKVVHQGEDHNGIKTT